MKLLVIVYRFSGLSSCWKTVTRSIRSSQSIYNKRRRKTCRTFIMRIYFWTQYFLPFNESHLMSKCFPDSKVIKNMKIFQDILCLHFFYLVDLFQNGVERATADVIYNGVISSFQKHDITLENIIGFGIDATQRWVTKTLLQHNSLKFTSYWHSRRLDGYRITHVLIEFWSNGCH